MYILPPIYKGITLESYAEAAPKYKDIIEKIKVWQNNKTNIFMVGDVGTGKTLLGSLLAEKFNGDLIKASTYFKEIRDGEPMWCYISSPLLVIDDLGTKEPSEFEKVELCNLIDERYKYLKTTVITSNLPEDYLIKGYGTRFGDRFFSNCLRLNFGKGSLRWKNNTL